MVIQKIISTMNKKSIEELNLEEKNLHTNILVINQTDNNEKLVFNNIKMINYNELGLSKSRNRCIENLDGDICIITDDDVSFVDEYEEIIINAFEKNKDADIITFQTKTPEGKYFKKYKSEGFWHNKRSLLKVASIEIAMKVDSIKKARVYYDEDFGLGAKYVSGEENIFLTDCLKKGLKIKYEPKVINIHEEESSGDILDAKAIYSKGALFYRLFGWKCFILNLVFIIKKSKILKLKKIESLVLIYKGSINYIMKRKK